jgi:hypothetical protein
VGANLARVLNCIILPLIRIRDPFVRERIFLIKPILKKRNKIFHHKLNPKELLMAGLVKLLV